ncbi:hypothetical protein DFH94DRAFT_347078 [Russula ochroleuca]|uniref:Uncharacterized protein n=1 Tax=Russula ochroleuca TaxID=152965 RepID=A0A9P5JVX1_9AGAM|nr:hypothetical protein DFH94DRAFT_347078 [Russula ochroleuca]
MDDRLLHISIHTKGPKHPRRATPPSMPPSDFRHPRPCLRNSYSWTRKGRVRVFGLPSMLVELRGDVLGPPRRCHVLFWVIIASSFSSSWPFFFRANRDTRFTVVSRLVRTENGTWGAGPEWNGLGVEKGKPRKPKKRGRRRRMGREAYTVYRAWIHLWSCMLS